MSKKIIMSLCFIILGMTIAGSSPDNLEEKIHTFPIISKYGNYQVSIVQSYDIIHPHAIRYQQYLSIAKNKKFKAEVIYFNDSDVNRSMQLDDERIMHITYNEQAEDFIISIDESL